VIPIVLPRPDSCGMKSTKRQLGDRGEQLAEEKLAGQGYEIVDANVQIGRNEIDLICRTADEVVFVEVKTADAADYGDPLYKIDRFKRRAIVRAAERWLLGHPQGERGIRFDVMSVDISVWPPVIDHRPAAFTADDT